jgi:hypothetical protein
MSKCDIRIDFDKPDRTYHGGEQVTGKVRISVNQDIQCNGIVLTHYWKTHGRGNTDQGPKTKIQLSELVPLQAGENLTLPFEFKADLWPLTYHGNYINVDHYVHVGIDVPWAIDPKQEEDYILVAGERPPQFTGKRDELIEIARPATEVSGIIKLFLYGILAIFAVVLSTLFFFLIPVFAFIGIGFWIWQKMIASRVGNVVIKTPHVVVGPGEQWPVELAFTARKTFPVNILTHFMTKRMCFTRKLHSWQVKNFQDSLP